MPAFLFEIMFCGKLDKNIMRKLLFQCPSKGTLQSFMNALLGVSNKRYCTERGSKILDLLGSPTRSHFE
jgi:hypothetical protein